jgi:hypothetical protein
MADDDSTKAAKPAVPVTPPAKGANMDPDLTRPAKPRTYWQEPDADEGEFDDRTHVAGGARRRDGEAAAGGAQTRILVEAGDKRRGPKVSFPVETASQPVCAILLIIRGPGQGICVPLSLGRSSIGRDKAARVQLDIGDPQLSGLHFIISYDDEDGSFDLREADAATNPTRVNGARAKDTVVLKAGDQIRAGGTEFRFVPCVGPDWNWSAVLTPQA